MKLPFAWEHIIGVLALAVFAAGQIYGLFLTPPDGHMGEVVRIMYVHVPTAWNAMWVFTIAFVAALGYLISGRRGFDWMVESTCEVGVLLNGMLLLQGAIWARPTWGIWWEWEPRLTSALVMFLTFIGVLMLRALVQDPDRRAVWTSVATILAFINVPITYYSVRLWRTIHQVQSAPMDLDAPLRWAWRLNVFAFTLIGIWFIVRRWRIAKARAEAEAPAPLPEEVAI